MRGLNAVRRLASIAVAALFVLPLLLPLVTALPVSAQPRLFEITSVIAVPEGLVGFYLNYTHARIAVGLTGLTLEFYVSDDGAAVIDDNDRRLGFLTRITVTADTRDVFGTLKLPKNETLYELLGKVEGTLYIKVSDGFRVIVASVPFDLRASKLFAALQLSKTKLAAVNNTAFGVTDRTNLTIDLRPYGPPAGVDLRNLNTTVRIVSEEHVLRLFENLSRTYRSDVFDEGRIRIHNYGSSFIAVNLSVLKEFPLNAPEKVHRVAGYEANYEDFLLEYFSWKLDTYKKAIIVDANRQVNTVPIDEVRGRTVIVSLAWPSTRTVDIYPSVRLDAVNRNAAGLSDELNVGDVITVTLRNFPKEAWIFAEIYLSAAIVERVYGPANLSTPTMAIKTNAQGSHSRLPFELPAAQYGGRSFLFAFLAGNETLYRGIPATNTREAKTYVEAVRPHVWIWSFGNDGRITSPLDPKPIAPGSYVLVVGRGFLAESLRFELMSVAEGVKLADLAIRSSTGVQPNGSFAAIVQLPTVGLPADLHGTMVNVVVRGETAENVGRTADITGEPGARNLALDYHGRAAVVYVEPRPSARSVVSFTENIIVLGKTVVPYEATWEPEDARTITVEAIGLNVRVAVRAVNVTLISRDSQTPGLTYRANATLALNQPVTLGYFRTVYPVPTLPHTYSGYKVEVYNRTTLLAESHDTRARAVRINATAAAIDPATGRPTKELVLVAARDVTIVGFGWAARLDVRYDVEPIVFAVDIPLATTDASGRFSGLARLPLYITQPGVYRLVVKQFENRPESPRPVTLTSFISVSIGVLPPFTIRLAVTPATFADLPVDVWVVAFFGGDLARADQVTAVSVAFAVDGVGSRTLTLGLASIPGAPGFLAGKAIYYGSFTPIALGAAVKGRQLLVVAYATGRYTEGAPLQEAYDVATLSVPPVTLAEVLAAVTTATQLFDQALAALSGISGKLDTLSTALGAAVTTIRGDIAAVRSDIESVKALVLEVNTNVGKAMDAILVVEGKLDKLNATVLSIDNGVAALRTDVAGLAELLKEANMSISRLVVDQTGSVIAAISDSKGEIVGAIKGNASAIIELVKAVGIDVKAVLDVLKEIWSKLDDINNSVGAAREDILRQLNVLLDIATAIRGDIEAVRSDIADVRALVLEVNTNVGTAIQAILTVADQNKVVLSKLDELGAAIEGVAGGVAAVRTDVAGLAELLKAANLSLSKLVVDQAGRVVAAISDSEGRIVGAVRAEASAVRDLVSAVRGDVRAVSDALAAFQSGAFSKLDAIASSVDAARGDILRLNTGLTAAATVITDIQGAVREVRTTVGGIATTVDTIKATVDSINAAVPNIATKDDVTRAASEVKGSVEAAKSDLGGAVAEAKDTAATSARNWGIINAILIIIAIAILAYATFVARRG